MKRKTPLKHLDKKTRPQDDFFGFVCNEWIHNNPIPKSKAAWGTFYAVREKGLKDVKRIVEDIAKHKRSKSGSEEQQIRALYRSYMDTKTRNQLGTQPIQADLDAIAAIDDHTDLIKYLHTCHNSGRFILFFAGVAQDDKHSDRYVTFLGQGGLSLPDRDHYLKRDPQSKKLQQAFLGHIRTMLHHIGTSTEESAAHAKAVFTLERKIAMISMNRVDSRNIDRVYNVYSPTKLKQYAPLTNWKQYAKDIGLGDVRRLIVMQPDFFKHLTDLIEETDIETWKQYLRFHLIDSSAPYLSAKMERDHFFFYGKTLIGKEHQEPRWKRGVSLVNGILGDAIGKRYIETHFDKRSKRAIDELVADIIKAYGRRIEGIDWMSPATKKKALKKLDLLNPKVGYPKKWESYRGMVLRDDALLDNLREASRYEKKREFKKLHKKVDRDEWFMNAHTVNAYYAPSNNDIVFPAGILQPPFFDAEVDAAFNYGAIGAVIGHEITHGFDDQGAKYDGKGNLANWWSKADKKAFEKRAQGLVRQYNGYTVAGRKVNGALTLGENIADLGGVAIAYDAYRQYLKRHGRHDIGGYTPEQRFFMGVAVFECQHAKREFEQLQVMTDPHSPSKLRVNGPLVNVDAFYDAFAVKSTDGMYRPKGKRTLIW